MFFIYLGKILGIESLEWLTKGLKGSEKANAKEIDDPSLPFKIQIHPERGPEIITTPWIKKMLAPVGTLISTIGSRKIKKVWKNINKDEEVDWENDRDYRNRPDDDRLRKSLEEESEIKRKQNNYDDEDY